MEELEEFMPDFDEWLKNYVEPERKFGAAFEPDTGQLVCVGPFVALQLEYEHITEIDEDIAVKIIDGEIKISNCFFDTNEGKFEITEEKFLIKLMMCYIGLLTNAGQKIVNLISILHIIKMQKLLR